LYWLARSPETLDRRELGRCLWPRPDDCLFHPYSDKSGVNVTVKNYGRRLKKLPPGALGRTWSGDVVDLELEDAASACPGPARAARRHRAAAGINGSGARNDFRAGAIALLGRKRVYSQVVAFEQ